MFRKANEAAFIGEEDGETIISRTCDIEGNLRADGTIKIYGNFSGAIETAGTVFIGKSARLMANITALNIAVAGTIKGNVTAMGRLEILSGGRVYGDIVAKALKIEEGGLFSGQSFMRELDSERLVLEAPAKPVLAQPVPTVKDPEKIISAED